MDKEYLKGLITISRSQNNYGDDSITIRLKDDDAVIEPFEISMSLEAFAEAITGFAYRPCKFTVRNLDKVGKVREHKTFEFQLPDVKVFNLDSKLKEIAREVLSTVCPDGWEANSAFSAFSSQDSFFSKDGKLWARTLITRWVPKSDKSDHRSGLTADGK